MILDTSQKIIGEIYDRILVAGDDGISKFYLEERFSHLGYRYLDTIEELLKDGLIIKSERLALGKQGKIIHYVAM